MKIIYNPKMREILSNNRYIFNNFINFTFEELDINDINFLDYYLLSLRIDEYFLNQKASKIEYLNVSLLILGRYFEILNKYFPEKKIIGTIQYDEGDEDVVEGFFIKCFEISQYNEYFNGVDILEINTPYIKITNRKFIT